MKSNSWHESVNQRLGIITILFSLGFILLTLRLWQVQVLQEVEHRNSVNRQSVRPVRLNPTRGRIFTATGIPLVDNYPTFDLVCFVSEMRQPGRSGKTLDYIMACEQETMKAIGRAPRLSRKELEKHIHLRPVMPLTIAENLTQDELARFIEKFPPVPGMEIQSKVRREHVYPGLASHVLGFTSWMMPDGKDVLENLPRIYVSPQLIGKSGLEQVFNEQLSGEAGSMLVRVDSIGYSRTQIGEKKEPVNGSDLYLTLDINAQLAAENVLKGHKGSLVAINVNTGAIVAMVSSPTFDLTTLDSKKLAEYYKDSVNTPMLNRATRGVYTPGSIVKPLIAMAALENGIITPEEEYDCTGRFKIGNHIIRCANRYGHGKCNVTRAITVSCNPFFLNIGINCGLDLLESAYKSAGFGSKTGIELSDLGGLRPSQELALKFWKRKWLPVDSAYASMGQGGIAITPLQAAVYTAAIANGGIVYKPYLVDEIRTQDGTLQAKTIPEIRNRLPYSSENIAIAQNAMRNTVISREGGARTLNKTELELAGKTGTAEVGSGENRHKNTWAIAYGPFSAPQYAVACVIENGESGSKTAIPIVAAFFTQWLKAE